VESQQLSDGLMYLRLQQEARGGARWFWWVAGLSAVNTIVHAVGGSWTFVMGLGLTQLFDAFATEFGGLVSVVALVLDVCVLLAFVVIGRFALRSRVAFVIGMVLYALDGLLLFAFQDFLSVAFHVLALVFMFKGMTSLKRLESLPIPQVSMEAASQPVVLTPVPETAEDYFDVN